MAESNTGRIGAVPDGKRAALLVEDNVDLREALTEFLELLGLQVGAWASGEAAIAGADAHNIDLLVTDLMLPGVNGLALADYFQRRHADLPVIVISGLLHAKQVAPRAGIRCVAKPFSLQEFRRLVEELIGASRTQERRHI